MRRPVPHWFAAFAVLTLAVPLGGCPAPVVAEPPKVADTGKVGVHSDSLGADDRNAELTQDRADEIKRLLMKAGVGGSRIKAVGYGETKPIASNDTGETRAKNRRVEIRVIGN